jgi:hypothetical protein
MELISIVDCELCVTLPHSQEVVAVPVPETWGRLATILFREDWQKPWSPDLARYPSAPDFLDLEEVRVCRSCGTHYHYRQIHDPHSGEPRPSQTDRYLLRITPTHARAYVSHMGPDGVVEYLDGGWLDQRYETLIGLLRRDLPRAPDLQIKKHIVDSLYAHYMDGQDWKGLKATLINSPDPAVGVSVASRIFHETHPDNLGRRLASSTTYWDDLSALLRAEPTREPLLVAVLAKGLSAPGQILTYFPGSMWRPAGVFWIAMRALRYDVPRQSLVPAIPALAAELQRPGSAGWWREAARDLLIKYVGAAKKRAKEVLEALAGDSDEARTVRAYCQRCLAHRRADSIRGS